MLWLSGFSPLKINIPMEYSVLLWLQVQISKKNVLLELIFENLGYFVENSLNMLCIKTSSQLNYTNK